jgi:hypothetical protein
MSALLELNDLKKHFLVTGLWRICGGGAPCAGPAPVAGPDPQKKPPPAGTWNQPPPRTKTRVCEARKSGHFGPRALGSLPLLRRPLRSRFEGWPNCEGLE